MIDISIHDKHETRHTKQHRNDPKLFLVATYFYDDLTRRKQRVRVPKTVVILSHLV